MDMFQRSLIFSSLSSLRHPQKSHSPKILQAVVPRRAEAILLTSNQDTYPAPIKPLRVRIQRAGESLQIILDDTASFDRICTDLQKAMQNCDADCYGLDAQIHIGSRFPNRIDIRRLASFLRDGLHATLCQVVCSSEALCRFATFEHKIAFAIPPTERSASESVVEDDLLEEEEEEEEEDVALLPEAEPAFHIVYKTLRSGTVLRATNDILIYGDINPGAVVEAGGNITVIGAARGVVHAGVKGNKQAFVVAHSLQPMQLRIADVIAVPHLESLQERASAPALARLIGKSIIIEDYRGRVPQPTLEKEHE